MDSRLQNHLSRKTIDVVSRQAAGKLGEYGKLYDIIADYVFSILQLNAHVLMYPLDDPCIWGFYEKTKNRHFVCINSSLEIEKQVFTAAHELYHLWFNDGAELVTAENIDASIGKNIPVGELKANRFASEFLISEALLRKEIKNLAIDIHSMGVKEILKLSNAFLVPYRAMVKRLNEVDVIEKNKAIDYLAVNEQEIKIWRTRLGYASQHRQGIIHLSNLVDLAMSAYEAKLITRAKLEYLLYLSNIDSSDLGIDPIEPVHPPSDEDIRDLLEDDE